MPWRRGPNYLNIPVFHGHAIYIDSRLLSKLKYYLNK